MAEQSFIGCDPGGNGALCLLKVTPEKTDIFFLDHKKSTPSERMRWAFQAGKECNVRMSMLEEVHSLFGMSAKSNFTFGGEFAIAKFVLEHQETYGTDLVKPKEWQKAVGIPVKKPKEKRTSAQLKKLVEDRCNQLYPGCSIYGAKGGLLDGRSDALMIAHYCMLKYKI